MRNTDPEYAMTGVFKYGKVRFIKKDGSSIVLPNMLNPNRFILIFDKYIKGYDQKKGYCM